MQPQQRQPHPRASGVAPAAAASSWADAASAFPYVHQQVSDQASAPPAWMVLLRGLPFDSTELHVWEFLQEHGVDNQVSDEADAVRVLMKASGRPSGQAEVKTMSYADAEEAVERLHLQYNGSRVVEAFLRQCARAAEADAVTVAPAAAVTHPFPPQCPVQNPGQWRISRGGAEAYS